jgi:hypothetical protein
MWSMPLDLTDEETAALLRLLREAIDGDRFPLSPRVQVLRAVPVRLGPEPAREPVPPRRVCGTASESGYKKAPAGWED